MQITTKGVPVWLTEFSGLGPQDFKDGMPVNGLSFNDADMTVHGWTRVGEAEITIEAPDASTLIANKVEALKALQRKLLGEAQAKATRIDAQIQKLLAITCDAPVKFEKDDDDGFPF